MQRKFGTIGGAPASRDIFDDREQAPLSKGIGWAQLLESQRILLIAEAGAGKTHECKAQAKLLFGAGEAAFFLRLEEVSASGVRLCLYGKQQKRFDDWRASASQMGYFFLDSIDELQLAHADFRDALERLGHDLEGGWVRATIVVTSRPVDIDRKAFAELLPVPKAVTDGGHEEEFAFAWPSKARSRTTRADHHSLGKSVCCPCRTRRSWSSPAARVWSNPMNCWRPSMPAMQATSRADRRISLSCATTGGTTIGFARIPNRSRVTSTPA